jgi:hypothetical protein
MFNTPAALPATLSVATLQFQAGGLGTYTITTAPTSMITLPTGINAASFDRDSTGRMWIAFEGDSGTIQVIHATAPYTSWSAPITLASGADNGDIAAVIAMPGNKIGVFWSNQTMRRFGFRTHTDGADPNTWTADETPAWLAEYDANGTGMADSHMNMKVAADGTLYVAVKTKFNIAGSTTIGLLVRRPNGTWDPMYQVETLAVGGNRPVVVLNETDGTIIVAYQVSSGSSNVLYKRSTLSVIQFGASQSLFGGSHFNASSSKQNATTDMIVVASDSPTVTNTRLITFDTGAPGEAQASAEFPFPTVAPEPPVTDVYENESKTKAYQFIPNAMTSNRHSLFFNETESRNRWRSRFSDKLITDPDLLDLSL